MIVLSGDTSPSDAVVNACNGCDVLLHAVYDGENTLAGSDLAYFTRFHTNARQLGELAERAHPRMLILYHQLFMGKRPDDLVRQVAATFRGPVKSAREFGRLLDPAISGLLPNWALQQSSELLCARCARIIFFACS